MRKPILVLYIILCCTLSLFAQTDRDRDATEFKDRLKKEYMAMLKERRAEYEAQRSQMNAEYAEHMRQAWTEYKPSPPKPVPARKEPPKPIVKVSEEQTPENAPVVKPVAEPKTPQEDVAKATVPEEMELPFDNVLEPEESTQPAAPVIPLPEAEPAAASVPGHTFSYYGVQCKIAGMNSTHRFSLNGVKENEVADAWEELSGEKYLPILSQCDNYRKELNLCDWGMVRFLQEMTTSFFSVQESNEAVLMQIYMLAQLGYKVRMARTDNRLVLLLPIEDEVFNYPYLQVDGIHYYVIDKYKGAHSYYVYDKVFPEEMALSLHMLSPPLLQNMNARTVERTLTSKKQVTVSIKSNLDIIDFYNDYPISSQWRYYSITSLSEAAKQEIYPILQLQTEGLDKLQAANVLLNFVQTAFEYKTDDEQFGYERPLFGDETLYYPYCDCEDRSILFSIFIRDLLGLDVVLLNYPNHLATAVKFEQDVYGDHIILDGEKYVLCDPTYIGAKVGNAMPNCRNEAAIVQRISKE